jgi:hypothetical protein
MRIVVAAINLLGFVGYLSLFGLSLGHGASAGGDGDAFAGLAMAYPLAYFATCFCTAFVRQRTTLVRNIGIIAHALLAVVILAIGIIVSAEGAAPFTFVGLFFGAAWLLMFYGFPTSITPAQSRAGAKRRLTFWSSD